MLSRTAPETTHVYAARQRKLPVHHRYLQMNFSLQVSECISACMLCNAAALAARDVGSEMQGGDAMSGDKLCVVQQALLQRACCSQLGNAR